MTREEYINKFKETYQLVHILANKEEHKIFRFRHKTLKRDIVLRSYSATVAAYEELVNTRISSLPEIYDVICLDDGMVVLEEYIDSITVAQLMEINKYNYRGAKKVLKEICSALTVLHGKGIIHRDIKPENVIITKDGRVVLIDFNASNKVSSAKKDTVIMGTVGYASPEQLGISRSDARTDIYALGVMLNVMLTGKHPSEQLAHGKAGKIVRKSTNINPKERYQTAQKFAQAL